MYLLIIIFKKSEFMAAQRARPILLNERFLVIADVQSYRRRQKLTLTDVIPGYQGVRFTASFYLGFFVDHILKRWLLHTRNTSKKQLATVLTLLQGCSLINDVVYLLAA